MSPLALVTGASSGIGEAYADKLAERRTDLVLLGRREDRLEELARRLATTRGIEARALPADLADAGDVARVCAEIGSLPLDILVNNAGLAHYKPFAELPPREADELLAVNVRAPVLLARAAVPGMVERGTGAIVNVASLLAFSGTATGPFLPQRAVYAATKSFLVTFSSILAAELEGAGVAVQVVCPGVVRSEFHSRQGIDAENIPRMEPEMIAEASLADLDRGVLFSIPAMSEESALDRWHEVSRELMSVARVTELPARYRAD